MPPISHRHFLGQFVVFCCQVLGTCSLHDARAEPIAGTFSYYEFVEAEVTWHEARLLARQREYQGHPGYLATLKSARENLFVTTSFGRDRSGWLAWFGGYEPRKDEVWLWADGPEAGVQLSLGEHAVATNSYINWGGLEPTNSGGVGHDFAAINLGLQFGAIETGEWLAVPVAPGPGNPIRGFLVEYPLVQNLPEPSLATQLTTALAILVLNFPRCRRS